MQMTTSTASSANYVKYSNMKEMKPILDACCGAKMFYLKKMEDQDEN